MRIALLPSAFAPAVGGVEELTARLARQLIETGDEVEVWTIRHPAGLAATEPIDGITVRRFELPLPRLSGPSLVGFPLARRRALRSLLAAAADFEPEVLHVQCFSANGIYAAWLARRLGVPLIVTLQGETVMDDHDIYERSLTLRLGLRSALRAAAAVTGCSQFVLADAESRFGLPMGRGQVIPNGVDLDEGDEPEPFELPFDRFVLGVGRIVEKKGFDLLVDAFATVADRHPDVGLVIGGDGPQRAALVERAAEMGLEERVAFPGLLSRAEVAWAMGAAELFVLPSRVEPFGIVVLEALRAGCPVLVSSRGGATEIVRSEPEGLVVDPADASAFAAALDRLLGDASLRLRLSESGPLRASDFAWPAIAERYRGLYRAARRDSEF
ncbi:MAG TPA: glycosyltransferase family 4 protein [Gaiellaceae bacterium]|nr:glycosyltransferase family 4 protein [Gaiellaceae bacterium]